MLGRQGEAHQAFIAVQVVDFADVAGLFRQPARDPALVHSAGLGGFDLAGILGFLHVAGAGGQGQGQGGGGEQGEGTSADGYEVVLVKPRLYVTVANETERTVTFVPASDGGREAVTFGHDFRR